MIAGPEVRQQLAEALAEFFNASRYDPPLMEAAADALLPVVERIAAERAAEALREEADVNWAERVRWSEVRTSLRARAEAMVTGRQETT